MWTGLSAVDVPEWTPSSRNYADNSVLTLWVAMRDEQAVDKNGKATTHT